MPVRPLLIALTISGGCGSGSISGGGFDSGGSGDGATTDAASAAVDAGSRADAFTGHSCAAPIAIEPGGLHAGTTLFHPSGLQASCSPTSDDGRDAVYVVDVGAVPVDVVAQLLVDESADVPYDAVLSARAECEDIDSELACADSGWGERIEALDVNGEVFLIVDGSHQFGGANFGDYSLAVESRAIVGADQPCDPSGVAERCIAGTRCIAQTCAPDSPAAVCSSAEDLTGDLADGVAERQGDTFAYLANHFTGSCATQVSPGFGERVFVLSSGGSFDLVATTDFPETDFDTVLYLTADDCNGSEQACADDVSTTNLSSRLQVGSLPAGTYYLTVDGSSSAPGTGHFKLRVELSPPAN